MKKESVKVYEEIALENCLPSFNDKNGDDQVHFLNYSKYYDFLLGRVTQCPCCCINVAINWRSQTGKRKCVLH